MIPPDDLPMVEESIRQKISGDLKSAHFGFRIRTKRGEIRDVEAYGSGHIQG